MAAATTALLKGASAIAIAVAGEIKLTLAVAEAAALPALLVSVLELDAELSILVADSVVSANRRVTWQSDVCKSHRYREIRENNTVVADLRNFGQGWFAWWFSQLLSPKFRHANRANGEF